MILLGESFAAELTSYHRVHLRRLIYFSVLIHLLGVGHTVAAIKHEAMLSVRLHSPLLGFTLPAQVCEQIDCRIESALA